MQRFFYSVFLWIFFLFTLTSAFAGSINGFNRSSQVPDTIPVSRYDHFYDSLRSKAHNRRWTKELYNVIILPPKDENDTVKTIPFNQNYEEFAGLTIRKITFVKLYPFGTDINDTSIYRPSRLNNFANTIHIKTRDPVLERHLLFHEREKIDPLTLADNERILRELPYIEDVRILVLPDSTNNQYAEVVIITQDRWSKAFFLDLKKLDAGKLEIWDRSIFGSGHEVQANLHWDRQRSKFFGYEAFWVNKNILGTFLNSRVYYTNVFDTHSYGLSLDRPFFTPDVKYAGGINMFNTNTIDRIWFADTLRKEESIHFKTLDAWLARSFSLNPKDDFTEKRKNITIASRVFRNVFLERPPEVELKVFPEYHTRTLWLNSLSYSAQDFYRSRLIYSYGQTEDIPIGFLADLKVGLELNEFENRYYSSISLAHGNIFLKFGYLGGIISLGSYITSQKELQQGVLQLNLSHFSNLYIIRQLKYRYFADFRYTRGINRFGTERLRVSDKEGVRGLNLDYLNAQQRITLKLEGVLFAPRKHFGFQFAYFGFMDFALLGTDKVALKDMDAFSGIGAGLRIRNERLVFPTIQFRFAFYPNMDGLNFSDYFQFSGEKKLSPPDYRPGKPVIIPFQ